jgi:basic amino acid/polyamine antiporter, APA family
MSELKKTISSFGVFSIASGAMISSGIFILPGLAYSKAGPALFLSYLLSGCMGLFGMLSMLELTTAMPKAGGDYYIINKTFGPLIGTVSGFLGWFALSLKSSFAIFGIAEIIHIYTGFTPILTGIFLCILFAAINIVGAKEAAWFQTGMVTVMILLMVVYIFSGIPHINKNYFNVQEHTGIVPVFTTAGFVFISFGGLLKAANMSEEVKNPRRSLPAGFISSIIVVTVLYVAMVLVMTGTLDGVSFSKSFTPAADSARITMGEAGYIGILISSVLAFFTTANAGVMAASRYPMALSIDSLVPSIFGRVNSRTGTPVFSIIVTSVLIYLFLLLPLEILVKAASTVILSSYVLTNFSVIIFRESRITNYTPSYRAPFYPWLQIVSIVIFAVMISSMGLSATGISLILLAAGTSVYFLYGRHRARKESALLHLFRRVADELLVDESLENDMREIIIDRDRIEQDVFDQLLKKSVIQDVKRISDFSTVVTAASVVMADELDMPAEEIMEKFRMWQSYSETAAVNDFLAIPHICVEGSGKIFLYVVRARDGIYFSESLKSVKAVFLLACSQDKRVHHLKTIAAVAALTEQHGFEKRWMEAKSTMELRNYLILNERKRYF